MVNSKISPKTVIISRFRAYFVIESFGEQKKQIMKLNGHLVKKVERGSIRLGWIYDKIEYLKANKSL